PPPRAAGAREVAGEALEQPADLVPDPFGEVPQRLLLAPGHFGMGGMETGLHPLHLAFPLGRLGPHVPLPSLPAADGFAVPRREDHRTALPAGTRSPVRAPCPYAGEAALAVRPIAFAYFRYVSTDAVTTRASIDSSSIPTKETFTHASITMPLSRIRSTTSAKLEESVDFCTFAMTFPLL